MDIKTFPIQMTKKFHKKLSKAAKKADKNKTNFIINAIEKEIKNVLKE